MFSFSWQWPNRSYKSETIKGFPILVSLPNLLSTYLNVHYICVWIHFHASYIEEKSTLMYHNLSPTVAKQWREKINIFSFSWQWPNRRSYMSETIKGSPILVSILKIFQIRDDRAFCIANLISWPTSWKKPSVLASSTDEIFKFKTQWSNLLLGWCFWIGAKFQDFDCFYPQGSGPRIRAKDTWVAF